MWYAKLRQDGRVGERHQVDAYATLRTAKSKPIDILIADVSAPGCLFVCAEPLEIGEIASVGFGGLGTRQVRIVRAERSRYGAEFVEPMDAKALAAALQTPHDAVIPFSSARPAATPLEADVASEERWPARASLMFVAASAAASWTVILVVHALRRALSQ